jgi:hypothetical protein
MVQKIQAQALPAQSHDVAPAVASRLTESDEERGAQGSTKKVAQVGGWMCALE